MPVVASIRVTLPVTALAVVLAGCGKPPPYPADLTFPQREDRLVLRAPTAVPERTGEPGKLDEELAALDARGGRTADPANAPADHRFALDRCLVDVFGSPAAPTLAGGKFDVPFDKLGVSTDQLAEGGRLYRRHCLQCHGLAGDGRGPTGQWVYPHPRDFRRGAFKFVTTGDGGKPRHADLHRVVREGLKGTAMPAFGLLPDVQREQVVAYVIYLSVRGQVEFQTLAAMLTEADGAGVDGDSAGFARARLGSIIRDWERAASAPSGPPVPPWPDDDARQATSYFDAVRRGYELFATKGAADCATCHEDFGRKAGHRYDVWGTVVRPADLARAGYKGGDQPEDLFRRVRDGIQPSGMPSHPALTDAQTWDIVRFVRALPYPRELPPDVRAKVYP